MANFPDQEFLEFIIKSLVDHPDDVRIERTIDDKGIFLKVHTHPEDMGQVIGRRGVTSEAIKSLLKIMAVKHSTRISMKIEEPEGSLFTHPVTDASAAHLEPAPTEEKPVESV